MRGAKKAPLFMKKRIKLHFFWKIFCQFRAGALAFSDATVPSDAACYLTAFGTIPPKLRSQNAAHDHKFPAKKHFFCKKMHFFRKIFGHVHFLLYLCTAFPPTWFKGVAKSAKTRLFSSVGQSTWFVISGSLVRIRQEAQKSWTLK